MNRPRHTKTDIRAVQDLEAAVIHLTRAMLRLDYLDDYLRERGVKNAGGPREIVADALGAVSGMLEDETIDDAAAKDAMIAKRKRSTAAANRT